MLSQNEVVNMLAKHPPQHEAYQILSAYIYCKSSRGNLPSETLSKVLSVYRKLNLKQPGQIPLDPVSDPVARAFEAAKSQLMAANRKWITLGPRAFGNLGMIGSASSDDARTAWTKATDGKVKKFDDGTGRNGPGGEFYPVGPAVDAGRVVGPSSGIDPDLDPVLGLLNRNHAMMMSVNGGPVNQGGNGSVGPVGMEAGSIAPGDAPPPDYDAPPSGHPPTTSAPGATNAALSTSSGIPVPSSAVTDGSQTTDTNLSRSENTLHTNGSKAVDPATANDGKVNTSALAGHSQSTSVTSETVGANTASTSVDPIEQGRLNLSRLRDEMLRKQELEEQAQLAKVEQMRLEEA